MPKKAAAAAAAIVVTGTGQWVAVGQGSNCIATSTNGTSWTGVRNATPAGGGIATGYGVAYGNGLWVAVGSGSNTIAISSNNGVSWTGITGSANGGLTSSARSVAYGNGLWVAVGQGSNTIATSTNGTSWTGRTENGGITAIALGVAYANNLWVAVGQNSNAIATSTNGITWTGVQKDTPAGGGIATGYSVAYANGLWVVVGYGTVGTGSNTIATSTNGVSWTGITGSANGGITTTAMGVAYGNGLWVVVGQGSNTIATSSNNGTSWTGRTANGGVDSIGRGIVYGNGLWVAVGQGSNTIATSANGNSWTGITGSANGGLTTSGYGVAFILPPLWVAVGFGGYIAKSLNGNVWTTAATVSGVSGKGGITGGRGVAYGKDYLGAGLWVAVGNTGVIAKSTDGNVWTPAATVSGVSGKGGITNIGSGVAYGKDGNGAGLWVAVGEGEVIAKSTDGDVWTPAATISGVSGKGGLTTYGFGVAYGKDGTGAGLWVAVGSGGLIAKSTDGNVWTPAATVSGVSGKGGITDSGRGVAYGKDGNGAGLWVAVGYAGIIAKSTDGNVWTPAYTSVAGNVGGITTYGEGVAYGKDALGAGLWVVVGQGGIIAKSTDGNIWTPAATSTYGNVGGITSPGFGVAFNEILYLRE